MNGYVCTFQVNKYVIALTDYTATDNDYLSFKKDTVIRIYEKRDVEPGYLWGILGEQRGKFPAKLVDEYDVRKY